MDALSEADEEGERREREKGTREGNERREKSWRSKQGAIIVSEALASTTIMVDKSRRCSFSGMLNRMNSHPDSIFR
jgi:hypothetical protein